MSRIHSSTKLVQNKASMTYRCEFRFKGQRLSVSSTNGMKVFKDGMMASYVLSG